MDVCASNDVRDCVFAMAVMAGVPVNRLFNFRSDFPNIGEFLIWISKNYKNLILVFQDIRIVMNGGQSHIGGLFDLTPLQVYVMWDNVKQCFHLDDMSGVGRLLWYHSSRFSMASSVLFPSFLQSWNVYSTPPRNQGNRNYGPRNPTGNRGPLGRGRGNPVPPVVPVVSAAPVVPAVPIVPPVPQPWDRAELVARLNGFMQPMGSKGAAEYLEKEAGLKNVRINSHSHPMSRAERFLLVKKLLVDWYWENAFQAVGHVVEAVHWVAPSSSVKVWARNFEEANKAALTAGFIIRSPNGNTTAPFLSFTANDNIVSNKRIVVDNFGGLNVQTFSPGSKLVFRSFLSACLPEVVHPTRVVNSGGGETWECEISAKLEEDPNVQVDVRNGLGGFDGPRVRIDVVGQGAFVDYANLVAVVSEKISEVDRVLVFDEPMGYNGGYGRYTIVARDDFSREQQRISMGARVKSSLVMKEMWRADPFWWFLFGEYLYDYPWFGRNVQVQVVDIPFSWTEIGVGSQYLTAAISKRVDASPFICSYPDKEFARKVSCDSAAYYSQVSVIAQRHTRRVMREAGVPFSNMDENRNWFSLGSMVMCCSMRKPSSFTSD